MKRNLLIRLMMIIMIIGIMADIAPAYEFDKCEHGTSTATMTLAADSSSGLTRLTVYGDTGTYSLNGSFLNLEYRYRVDTVLQSSKDSIALYIIFTPISGSASDTLVTQFYVTKKITIAAPSTNWTYGAISFKLDTTTTGLLNHIIKLSFDAADSASEAQGNVLAGRSFNKYFEYFLEVWK
jgi:hypothetical protein